MIITDPLEHPQGVLVAELHVEPGGRVAGAHRHPGVVERFQVVRGTVNYLIDGREVTLGPGGSAEVPATLAPGSRRWSAPSSVSPATERSTAKGSHARCNWR